MKLNEVLCERLGLFHLETKQIDTNIFIDTFHCYGYMWVYMRFYVIYSAVGLGRPWVSTNRLLH